MVVVVQLRWGEKLRSGPRTRDVGAPRGWDCIALVRQGRRRGGGVLCGRGQPGDNPGHEGRFYSSWVVAESAFCNTRSRCQPCDRKRSASPWASGHFPRPDPACLTGRLVARSPYTTERR